jgi:hypothetical protein
MKSDSELYRIGTEAMNYWDALRANGASIPDATKSLEAVLREYLTLTREWKYLCSHCDDYGLVMGTCSGDATCGRDQPHLPHSFGTPCWCERGNKFRKKLPADPDDFAQAGRTRKPTRMGR